MTFQPRHLHSAVRKEVHRCQAASDWRNKKHFKWVFFVASAFVALANAYLNNVIKQVSRKVGYRVGRSRFVKIKKQDAIRSWNIKRDKEVPILKAGRDPRGMTAQSLSCTLLFGQCTRMQLLLESLGEKFTAARVVMQHLSATSRVETPPQAGGRGDTRERQERDIGQSGRKVERQLEESKVQRSDTRWRSYLGPSTGWLCRSDRVRRWTPPLGAWSSQCWQPPPGRRAASRGARQPVPGRCCWTAGQWKCRPVGELEGERKRAS